MKSISRIIISILAMGLTFVSHSFSFLGANKSADISYRLTSCGDVSITPLEERLKRLGDPAADTTFGALLPPSFKLKESPEKTGFAPMILQGFNILENPWKGKYVTYDSFKSEYNLHAKSVTTTISHMVVASNATVALTLAPASGSLNASYIVIKTSATIENFIPLDTSLVIKYYDKDVPATLVTMPTFMVLPTNPYFNTIMIPLLKAEIGISGSLRPTTAIVATGTPITVDITGANVSQQYRAMIPAASSIYHEDMGIATGITERS